MEKIFSPSDLAYWLQVPVAFLTGLLIVLLFLLCGIIMTATYLISLPFLERRDAISL
jgi:hypothetical protein